MSTYLEDIDEILSEIKSLLEKKHSMYGENNLKITGLVGIATRLMDKAARLHQLATIGSRSFEEGVEDTLKDIAGYAINALRMYRRKELTAKGILGGDQDE